MKLFFVIVVSLVCLSQVVTSETVKPKEEIILLCDSTEKDMCPSVLGERYYLTKLKDNILREIPTGKIKSIDVYLPSNGAYAGYVDKCKKYSDRIKKVVSVQLTDSVKISLPIKRK